MTESERWLSNLKALVDDAKRAEELEDLLKRARLYVYIATQAYDNNPNIDTKAVKLLAEIDELLGKE